MNRLLAQAWALLILLAFVVGPYAARAQENSPAKAPPGADERLNAIEKTLERIVQEIQALKDARTPSPEKSESAAASKPAASEEKPAAAKAETGISLPAEWLKSVTWRSLGPANMGGRITDLAVHDKDTSLWYIATASGGLLKTTNHGVTVEHQFDREETVSIGAVAVAPTDANIVWVGTGEANPRNSVSYGDGVYKSTDGGKTWKNMGLKKSFQIGRILIHPQDPNIVYVGALGRLYGPHAERGVFKTTNGGETWEKVLFVDERTGVIDMIMHPEQPDTIIAAMWDRQRDGYDSWPGNEPKPEGVDGYDPIRKWGAGGGLYKTTDGGTNWKRLTSGLPTSMLGRIGLDWQTKSPHVIYAIIDCESIGKGPAPLPVFLGLVATDVDGGTKITQITPDSPAAKAGLQVGDMLVALGEDKIQGFDQLLDLLRQKKVRDKISLEIKRGDETHQIEAQLAARPDQRQSGLAGVWLGVTGEDRDNRVVLTRVLPDGPAAKAGLEEGDTILQLDAKDIANYMGLIDQVRTHEAGDKLKLKIRRGEEKRDIELTLENRPGTPSPSANPNVYMGIQGQDAEKTGATLSEVTDGGPAQKAGLEAGDIVVAIDSKPVANYEGLVTAIRAHKAGDKVKLSILRGSEQKEVELTFAERPEGPSSQRPYTFSYFGQTPNIQDQQGSKGFEYGGVYRSMDAGETWERVNSLNTRPMYFSVIRVDPSDANRVYVLGVAQFRSDNGGITFTGDFGRNVHADGHDLWIDPNDGRHMVTGGDGGFYTTYDRGNNWDHVNTAAIGQFYHVAISPKYPYWVFGGLQDNGSWGGPAISKNGGVLNEDWISVGGGDGFVCRVDQDDPDLVYYESQNGAIARRHLRTGERASIRPERKPGATYRFNWNTPFILSNHNAKIFYSAGNYVFRSLDRGNNLVAISPEITLTKRGSATALAESPRNPQVLYVGTDDGALWVTRDGGHEWKNITEKLGLPSPRWVSTIEPSRFADGRVYVCLDGHRSDDDDPYLFVSEDYGETWRSLRGNLPWGSTRCLREDPANANLLFAGTEFALWTSLDRGQNWVKLNTNLPTVAIHEVAFHPTNGEIVVATHGRSLWACDISPLRQLKPEHLKDQIALLKPNELIRWRSEPSRGRTNRRYVASNPPSGAQFWYTLPAQAKQVSLRIEDIEGKLVRELRGGSEAGLHRITWDLSQIASRPGSPAQGMGRRLQVVTPPADAPSSKPANTLPPGPPQEETRKEASQKETKETEKGEEEAKVPEEKKLQEPPREETKKEVSQEETNPTEKGEGEAKGPEEKKSEEKRPAESDPPQPTAEKPAVRGGTPPGSAPGEARRAPAGAAGAPAAGVGRPASNGTYRAVLVVDGRPLPAQTIAIVRDPHAPADAVAEEIVEQDLRNEQRAAEEKRLGKRAGRSATIDD